MKRENKKFLKLIVIVFGTTLSLIFPILLLPFLILFCYDITRE